MTGDAGLSAASAPADTANVLSGAVAGHAVQAAVVHGGVHFHGAPSAVPEQSPHQLLAPPAHFTGRQAELGQLDDILLNAVGATGPTVAVLSGPGGVGKTALALRWAHGTTTRFTDGQLYIDLAGFSGEPVDPGEALGQFLRALGVASSQVPTSLAEQAAMFRSRTAGLALFVLLDSAYSAAQVRVLLPSSPRSAVVVTSRSRLTGLMADGARLIEVRPLAEPAAVALLDRAVGAGRVDREPEHAAALVELCGGMPLAVRLAAARLAARPRWSVARVVAELADEQRRLSGLAVDGDVSVRATFDLSYQLLPRDAAVLYRRMGLHPGPEFGPGVAAAAVAGTVPDAERLLETLVDANLVEEVGEEHYRFHDLLRLHARDRAAADEPLAERDAALLRMLEWYLAAAMAADRIVAPTRRRLPYEFAASPAGLPELVEHGPALDWLDAQRVNLMSAGKAALDGGLFPLAWQLADVMWPLLQYRKHYRDRVVIDERGLAAARAWGDRFAEADMLKRLGRALTTLGRHDEAERRLRESVATWAMLDDEHGVASAREMLGCLFLDTGRPAAAVEEFERELAGYRSLGNDRGAGLALSNLGVGLLRLGRTEDALRRLAEAEAIFDRLADVDPYNGARVRVMTGAALGAAGRFADARRAGQAGLETMRRHGSQFGEAEAYEVLAEVELRCGDVATARQHFDRAMATFTELRSPRARVLNARLGRDLRVRPTGGGGEP